MVEPPCPIFRPWPASTWIRITPLPGAGISVEILSVSSIKIGSPSLTSSPSFLSQAERSPEVIDSPTAGIFTSIAMRNCPCLEGEGLLHQLLLLVVVPRLRADRRARRRRAPSVLNRQSVERAV